MLFEWHRKWLGNVYYWAGERRTVNMGKGGFEFTAAAQILKSLTQFEKEYLSKFNGLNSFSRDEVVSYLAESHVEFILIHPFSRHSAPNLGINLPIAFTQYLQNDLLVSC
ncbi:Fic family protein [Shewanella sp. Pdp11]|uniref:Fic family protein n=1 Tax=Shewanella sp. Pdp11 TaxID=2059264 RepID=UPI0018E3E8BF